MIGVFRKEIQRIDSCCGVGGYDRCYCGFYDTTAQNVMTPCSLVQSVVFSSTKER